MSDRRLAFTTTVRVVDGVHGNTTHRRTNAAVTGIASLSEDFLVVIKIANLSNSGPAVQGKLPDLAGWHADLCPTGFLGQ